MGWNSSGTTCPFVNGPCIGNACTFYDRNCVILEWLLAQLGK